MRGREDSGMTEKRTRPIDESGLFYFIFLFFLNYLCYYFKSMLNSYDSRLSSEPALAENIKSFSVLATPKMAAPKQEPGIVCDH